MNTMKKPLAFVDESGFVVPNPTFPSESLKYIKGRFIYTTADLQRAIDDMNQRQNERRELADEHYGSESVLMDTTYEHIEVEVDRLAGTRETVPSMTASPTRSKKTEGKSKKLTQPNYAPLPETLNVPQQGVNLTDEEREDLQGIDTAAAVQAMFG